MPVAHDNGDPLGSLAYPLVCSSKPRWLSPRALIGTHRSSRISFDKRRHAPAPRLRCGTSKMSNTACVLIRSIPSPLSLPRSCSSRSRQGSAFRAAISACASLILVRQRPEAHGHSASSGGCISRAVFTRIPRLSSRGRLPRWWRHTDYDFVDPRPLAMSGKGKDGKSTGRRRAICSGPGTRLSAIQPRSVSYATRSFDQPRQPVLDIGLQRSRSAPALSALVGGLIARRGVEQSTRDTLNRSCGWRPPPARANAFA